MVLFATNLIKNYDPAFRRRILDHIEFPLPDAAARGRIAAIRSARRARELLPEPDRAPARPVLTRFDPLADAVPDAIGHENAHGNQAGNEEAGG